MLGMVLVDLRTLIHSFAGLVVIAFRTRVSLQLEALALRLRPVDRLLCAWLSGA